ncbi:MAG: hypothetical protein RR922_05040 [Clostridia bacterium]
MKKNNILVKILPILALTTLSISVLYALTPLASRVGVFYYNYTIPGNGNGIGTPVVHKDSTGEQSLQSINIPRNINIRMRQKTSSNEYSRSGLYTISPYSSSFTFTLSTASTSSPGYPNGNDARAQNYLMMCSPNDFYIQNYTQSGAPATPVQYSWYL